MNDNKNSNAKIKANNKYKDTHYSRIAAYLKPEEAERIRTAAKDRGISIAQIILKSVDYIIENNIDV